MFIAISTNDTPAAPVKGRDLQDAHALPLARRQA